MRWFKADLHIHSVLSPCGSLQMSPKNVIKKAKEKRLDMIAITDHNSMANCRVYEKFAERNDIKFIYGVEIQSAEEIHILSFFDEWDKAQEFDNLLYESLLPRKNEPEFFGDQVVIDEHENIVRMEEKALINSSVWSFEEVLKKVHDFGGFAVPAHVDATSFSVLAQLGFIPENSFVSALEITKKCSAEKFLSQYPNLRKYALIKNSDAHYPEEIGSGFTEYYLQEPTVEEIMFACKNFKNRKIKN
ncbi:MAG: phosphoesterase [Candidatus Cloacimonadota bacterium]|nr:MAG: phosphoesterase [Candidatus Cloacimonadota bacterium]